MWLVSKRMEESHLLIKKAEHFTSFLHMLSHWMPLENCETQHWTSSCVSGVYTVLLKTPMKINEVVCSRQEMGGTNGIIFFKPYDKVLLMDGEMCTGLHFWGDVSGYQLSIY